MSFIVEEQSVWIGPCAHADTAFPGWIAFPLVKLMLRLVMRFALLRMGNHGFKRALATAGIEALTASAAGIGFLLRHFAAPVEKLDPF